MMLWLDDIRKAPTSYVHAHSVNEAKEMIINCETRKEEIEIIDVDHDLGDYYNQGGDAIRLLDWLVERETYYPIRIHTSNPVGRASMKRLIERYWK